MNKSYVEWIDYYENATKEDVIQDMILDINSIKEKNKEIERLTAESTEWESKYYQLQDIIKEAREKLLCYGETFNLKVHQEMQKELLEILDKEVN